MDVLTITAIRETYTSAGIGRAILGDCVWLALGRNGKGTVWLRRRYGRCIPYNHFLFNYTEGKLRVASRKTNRIRWDPAWVGDNVTRIVLYLRDIGGTVVHRLAADGKCNHLSSLHFNIVTLAIFCQLSGLDLIRLPSLIQERSDNSRILSAFLSTKSLT